MAEAAIGRSVWVNSFERDGCGFRPDGFLFDVSVREPIAYQILSQPSGNFRVGFERNDAPLGTNESSRHQRKEADVRAKVIKHHTGTHKRAAAPEQEGPGKLIRLKTKAVSKNLGVLRPIRKYGNDAVADEANFRFGGHRARDARQFIKGPPVVGIEKSDQFATAFGNAVIKSRGLAAVGFAKNANL